MSEETRGPGQPTKYKVEYDQRIVDLAKTKEGRHMYGIASIFGVCAASMLRWCEEYPSFCEAYACAKNDQRAQMLNLVYDNLFDRNLNQTGLNLIFRHGGDFAEQRTVRIMNISKGSHNDKVQAILDFCAKVGMTPDELQKSMGAVAIAAKIDEVTDQAADIKLIKDTLIEQKK